MNRFIIMSLLLIGIASNKGYNMDGINNINSDSISIDSSSSDLYDNANNSDDDSEIDFDNENETNHFANMENKELKEFERWSYEKLIELNNNKIICNCNTCNKCLKTIKNELKKLLFNNEQLCQDFIEYYMEFIKLYFDNTFYTEDKIIYTESISNMYINNIALNMKKTFNKTDKNIIYKILSDNINKFIYHHCRDNKIKSEILRTYLLYNKYTLNVLSDKLLEALIINNNDYLNPKYDNCTDEQILFKKFKEYFEQRIQKSKYNIEFLDAVNYMIAIKWITNIDIIKYVARQKKQNSNCNIF